MSQPKYKISEYNLKCLKLKLEEKLSFRIFTKLDCKKAAEIIQKNGDNLISESTMYRIFLWEENKNIPYLHTLDIIAQFIGYQDWFSLEKYFIEIVDFQRLYGVFPDQRQYKSLLSLNIHHGDLKPLYNFLEQFPTDIIFDKKMILGEDIFISLKTSANPTINRKFYKQFHSLPIVREGFFEIFSDPDFSISDYEIGLGYYLKNIKPHKSLKSLQDYIFANSLLLRFYFLKGRKEDVLKLGKELYFNIEVSEKEFQEIYIFPKMRYLSYRLFYNEAANGFDQNYFEWLLDFAFKEIQKANLVETRIVIHTICDTLRIYPKLQENTFNQFVLRCPEVFKKLPDYICQLPVRERLRFLDQNATTFFGKN